MALTKSAHPAVLPKANIDVLANEVLVRKHSRKLTPVKLIFIICLSLLSLGFLRIPPIECYRRAWGHIYGQSSTFEHRAQRVLLKTPLIDGHVDFPLAVRFLYGGHLNDAFSQPFTNGSLVGQVDLARLRQGYSGGAFWSVFAPCPANDTDFTNENYAASVQFTLDQIDLMSRIQSKYPTDFSGKVDSSNAMHSFKERKLISPLGVEGLHQIGNSAGNLRLYYELGVRYATLTHNCHNKYADAALLENPMRKAEPLWGGVSPLGRKLIHEMNRIGMIVDLSHVSESTMIDVLGGGTAWGGSEAPVIYSHSSAWSICPHPRNVKDHVLQLVKHRNSVVMVNIAPQFISCSNTRISNGIPEYDPANNTIQQVVKHIIYIGNLIGYDHVGIGTDFDGIGEEVPKGFEDVSKYVALVAELLKQGVSDADAAKIVGGNILRVWKEVDAVAATMKANGAPVMEDDVKTEFIHV